MGPFLKAAEKLTLNARKINIAMKTGIAFNEFHVLHCIDLKNSVIMLQNKQSKEFGCVAYRVIFASVVQQGQKKAIMDSIQVRIKTFPENWDSKAPSVGSILAF